MRCRVRIFMNPMRRKRLQASSMTYAVFIMAIVLIILGSVIIYAYLNKSLVANTNQIYTLQSNINSGINLLLAEDDICSYQDSLKFSLYGKGNDSISLSKSTWGVFDQYQVKTWWKHQSMRKAVLAGGYHSMNDNQVLYLEDQNRPLSISGSTVLRGDCKLPVSGIKKTVIDGVTYQGNTLVDGHVSRSDKDMPELKQRISEITYSHMLKQYLFEHNLTILDYEDLVDDSLQQSFSSEPLVIYYPGEIKLEYLNFDGNIVILSEERIQIDSTCILKDVLVSAPSIYLNSGFTGCVQCIAMDTIIVGPYCKLEYPSALVLNRGIEEISFDSKAYLSVKEYTDVHGLVISNTTHNSKQKTPVVNISESAKIHGQLYCNSYLQMRGELLGTAYVKSFFLKSPSSIYENHLLHARFDKPGFSNAYVGVELFSDDNIKSVIKCLQ